MRIDKYLKNSRLIKRRSLAKEACELGKVLVNGKEVKPGYEVSIGDKIMLTLGSKETHIEVIAIEEHVTKDSSRELFRLI